MSTKVAFDPSAIDWTVDPTQNFYRFACGTWLNTQTIPPGYSTWSLYNQETQSISDQMKKVLDNQGDYPPKGNYQELVYRVYNSARNIVERNKVGIAPIESLLSDISTLETIDDVIRFTATLYNKQTLPFFGQITDPHPAKPDLLTAVLDEGGMHLPNHMNYKDPAKLNYLNEYAVKLFCLAGWSKEAAEAGAQQVLGIETRLADACMSSEDKMNPALTSNVRNTDQISDNPKTSENFQIYFNQLAANTSQIVVTNPNFIEAVSQLWNDFPIEGQKAYMRFTVLDAFSGFLTEEFEDARFTFYSMQLSGVQEKKSLEDRCMDIVYTQLLEAAGRVWVDNFYPAEKKERLHQLATVMHDQFLERVHGFTWMQDETHKKALLKAKRVCIQPAFPEDGFWRDYDGLKDIDEKMPLGANMLNAMIYNAALELNKIGTATEKRHWLDTCWKTNFYYLCSPNESNAFNKFNKNTIYLAAGYYQQQMFDCADPSVFGSTVSIAHEMHHSLDPTGRHYDPDNVVEDWWTKIDSAHFDKEKEKVIKQFNDYYVTYSDGTTTENLNGALVCRENMSDIGALEVAYHAMKKYMLEKGSETIDGFTPEQRFFLAYAQAKMAIYTDAALKSQVETNEHAPAEQRVNGCLAQTATFWEAFNVKEIGPMRVPPVLKCRIWETGREEDKNPSYSCNIS